MGRYFNLRLATPPDRDILIRSSSTSFGCRKRVCKRASRWGRYRYRGVALIWAAIVSFVMILFVGLSIDVAKVSLVFHQMQNASDAAALAGATIVRGDRLQARLLTQQIARQNSAEGTPVLLNVNVDNDPNGDIVIGWYNRDEQTFSPGKVNPTLSIPWR